MRIWDSRSHTGETYILPPKNYDVLAPSLNTLFQRGPFLFEILAAGSVLSNCELLTSLIDTNDVSAFL